MDKKVAVVTGGAGFVGSHLCERLIKEGYSVISLDNYFTGTTDNHVDGVKYRTGHTKDIAKHITETPDIIFHLGEYSRVEQSVLEPDVVHDLNVRGTEGVIAFWKQHACKLVYAGSSTKFGDGGTTRDTSPYAQSKATNSEMIHAIGQKENLPYAITYFYNVYGPRERSGVYGTVVEHFRRMYLSGAPCAVVLPGTQTRNFTHVCDIVDGLLAVGEKGSGDEYGLGNEQAHSILDVVGMFGCNENMVMFPERQGNRMASGLDTSKAASLGWRAQYNLSDYIAEFVAHNKRGNEKEKRVLVFSTTMHPIVGLAEEAFADVARALPDVTFDVVTSKFTRETHDEDVLPKNVILHRVGFGVPADKFLLPFLGLLKGLSLSASHQYLFVWSLMASYAAIAASFLKLAIQKPFLITLADQNLGDVSALQRWVLSRIITRSDQVYGSHSGQEQEMMSVSGKKLPRNSLGEGDAFANALRFAYADIVRKSLV